jgi:hypothetical protein
MHVGHFLTTRFARRISRASAGSKTRPQSTHTSRSGGGRPSRFPTGPFSRAVAGSATNLGRQRTRPGAALPSLIGGLCPAPGDRPVCGRLQLSVEVIVGEDRAVDLTPPAEFNGPTAGSIDLVDARSPATRRTRRSGDDPCRLPSLRTPPAIQPIGRLGEVALPPPRHPAEGSHDRRAVEDLVECLIEAIEDHHDGAGGKKRHRAPSCPTARSKGEHDRHVPVSSTGGADWGRAFYSAIPWLH